MGITFSVSFASEQCILPILCCLCGKAGGVCKLEDNLVELRRDFNALIAERDGVLDRVHAEEINGRLRLPVVANWLSEVQTIETNTNQLFTDVSAQEALSLDAPALDAPAPALDTSVPDAPIQDAPAQEAPATDTSVSEAPAQETPGQNASDVHERQSTFGHWSKKIVSTYSLAEKVLKMLNEVRNLSLRGVFEVVTQKAPPPMVEVRPYQQTFGLITTLEKTWRSLMDDETRMLGIYGMGGIGKTTLLTLINNMFVDFKDNFDIVIWVKVSKDADVGTIQDDIGKRLGLYDEDWGTYSKTEKACEISRVLTNVKPRFVLLLDDLWKEVSLATIGIPLQGKRYKVVLATRFQDVCGRMGANEDIEVQFLAENDAWDLFKQKARCGTLNDQTSVVAKRVAVKCCGLPLALEVIGKTLASKTTVGDWRRALSKLESNPIELRGTENGLFRVLKLSYDNLEDQDVKLCFQYCALFPKAYNIKRDELVDYWIGEGIIDKGHRRQKAKDRGDDIIDILVEACLLLKDGESEQKVCMHDMIREMALWIVSTLEDGEKYFVKAGACLKELPCVTDWTTVTKMSLMNNEIKSISDDHEFPNPACLITLFLQKNMLAYIVGKFFQVMSTLVVLDLSGNLSITELPTQISHLISLRLLNLSGTSIKDLPQGLRALTQLIHLDLDSTCNLQSISSISGLLKLQVLRFHGSAAALDLSLLNELDSLKNLQVLTITVREVSVLEAFLGSKWRDCTQGLYLEGLNISGASLADIGALGSLYNLELAHCDITETEGNNAHQNSLSNSWFKNLSAVVLLSCVNLKDLTWLKYAKNLESLNVESLPKMERLINEENAAGVEPFQNLQALRLHYLNELRSFYGITFPKLKQHKVDIANCPNLHERPIDSTSV